MAASGEVDMVKLLMPNDCSIKERCSSTTQKGPSDIDGGADWSLCLSVSGDSVAPLAYREPQQTLNMSRIEVMKGHCQRGGSQYPALSENVEDSYEYLWNRGTGWVDRESHPRVQFELKQDSKRRP